MDGSDPPVKQGVLSTAPVSLGSIGCPEMSAAVGVSPCLPGTCIKASQHALILR
jgi:hypothetical protein